MGHIDLLKRWGLNNFYAFDYLLFTVWGYSIIVLYINVIICRFFSMSIQESPILTVVIVFMILASLPYMRKYITIVDVSLYCCITVLYYSQSIIYPDNSEFLKQLAKPFFLYCLPYYGLFKCLNIDKRFAMFRFMAVVSTLIYAILFLFMGGPDNSISGDEEHSMTMAYSLLPHVLILIWSYFKQRNGLNFFFALLGILLLLAMGTRGPVLCLCVFSVGFSLLYNDFNSQKKTRLKMIISILIIILFLKPILNLLGVIITDMGMSTRVVSMFLEGDISDANGRDIIQETLLSYIESAPFWGYGLAGDRVILSSIWSDGGFTHNLVIEMMVSFGVVPGLLICALIIFFIVFVLKRSKNNNNTIFFWLLVSICVSQLFSGSFLQDPYLYMMFGFGVNVISKNGAANDMRYHATKIH